ncbi:MAG: hypothetical protein Q7S77_03050 [Candidatus Staskawiczbacteria bacterium]|nr:hypothetical protein [Candidatus Staskawiczbacteria bacterium]
MNKKIIFIFLALVIIVGGFFSFWLYSNNIFSKEVLKLEILGQEEVKMGDEIEYTVKYKNNGNAVLQEPKLIFELPEHSLTEDDKTRFTQDLKDIYPGDEDFVKFKTRLLGSENSLNVAKAWLSYMPKNLTVRFESSTTFTTKIDSVPITLDFDLPSKSERGKEIQYSLNYFSNVDFPLENLSIKIDSITGFQLESSTPSSLDKSEWKIPTLNKSEGGRITVNGRITGDVGHNLNFGAKLGMWQDGEFVLIKDTSKEISIVDPLIFISQRINGYPNYVASPGEKLHYEIFFRNIGSTPFDNLFLLTKLDGQAIDAQSIKSSTGEVRADDRLIAWDYKQIPELKHLDPQQEGKVEFDVQLNSNWNQSDSEKNNTTIKNKVDISQISEDFQTKVNSKIEALQKGYYSSQAGISNSGPIPPRVDTPTTYAITWSLKNYFNDVKNVKIRAVLPQNVTLADKLSPETESSNFSFDNNSREIVWNVSGGATITVGTGIVSNAPSISFQVSLTPDSYQKGKEAILIGEASISAEDQFTGAVTQSRTSSISTNLPDDKISSGGGIVQ